MNELLKQIKTKLQALSGINRVYTDMAPPGTPFPYIVYNLPTSDTDFTREDFVLEVDVWGNNPDTRQIDSLTDSIDGNGAIDNPTGLNRFHYYNAGVLQADFYRINRLMIPDQDEKIRRRQLRYEVKTYLGG
jgi:hypothetical protein